MCDRFFFTLESLDPTLYMQPPFLWSKFDKLPLPPLCLTSFMYGPLDNFLEESLETFTLEV